MLLPLPLLRRNPKSYKNEFGHVLVLAGSSSMLGAAALVGLAAMRSGAGLTTIGVPKSLNSALQQKISPVIMTMPLPETKEGALALGTLKKITGRFKDFDVLALGPGLSRDAGTKKLILKIIAQCPLPMVIDGDALTALADDLSVLKKNSSPKVLTPHTGEMVRLTKLKKEVIEQNRKKTAKEFAQNFNCTLILKGPGSLVVSPEGEIFTNSTGNPGMATAGSGDVLTGMIAAFLGQGLSAFDAGCLGVYLHGLAGDLASKNKTRAGLIATDLIEMIPEALKKTEKQTIL